MAEHKKDKDTSEHKGSKGGSGESKSHQESRSHTSHSKESGDMTVSEAGHKGGERVRELIEEGKQAEEEK